MTSTSWSDREQFLRIQDQSKAVVNINARLPDQVFKGGVAAPLFVEFDLILTPGFWSSFRQIARWHGDSQVDILVVQPDCEDFYYPRYRSYPAISVPVDVEIDDYWTELGHEPYGEIMGSIPISANVVTVTGPSRKWACWGERDPELAIFVGFPDAASRKEWRSNKQGLFMESFDEVLECLSLAFRGEVVPDHYAAAFRDNYDRPDSFS